MDISLNHILVLVAVGLAFARSSKALPTALERLQRNKDRSQLYRTAYQFFFAVSALPDFVYSSKAIDLILQYAGA